MAEEKTIVLNIETVTDQDVMEQYGEVLNNVLGSYEDNIALITQYNAQLKANNDAIKEINKAGELQGKLSQKQKENLASLTAENGKLAAAKSELIQITKNQEKINTSQNGTMENQSHLLGKLRMAWRQMTDEQKKANPQMLKTIQQLDKHLKDSDGKIGNFHRNVGNYKSALAGYQGALKNFAGAIPGVNNVLTQLGSTAGIVGLAIGGVTGAFKFLKSAMETTQTTGDALERAIAGWAAGWEQFKRMIATMDFSNFLTQIGEARDAARDLYDAKDEMFEINNSIELQKAMQAGEEQKLMEIFRDATRSIDVRIAAGKAYIEKHSEFVDLEIQGWDNLANKALNSLAAKARTSPEKLGEFILKYQSAEFVGMRDAVAEYEKALKEAEATRSFLTQTTNRRLIKRYVGELQALQKVIDETPQKIKDIYEMQQRYNRLDDKSIAEYVEARKKVLTLRANLDKEMQRVKAGISNLQKQQNDAEKKAAEKANADAEKERDKYLEKATSDIAKGVATIAKAEASALKKAKDAMLAGIRGDNKVVNSGLFKDFQDALKLIDKQLTSTPELAVSPFARWLGVTDKQLETLKQTAEKSALQIFGSIQKISQQSIQRRLDNDLEEVENEAEREKAILEAKLESNLISQKEYEKRLADLDEETATRKEALQKDAYNKNKAWSISQAIINGALAITNIWAQHGGFPIVAGLLTAMSAAVTGAEIAAIAAQKFARGGELHGASHANGGIKGFVGNRHIEAEGGEVIINKRSSAKHRKLLSLINSDNNWGVDFANARGNSNTRFFARGGVLGGYDFRPAPLPDTASGLAMFAQQQTANIQSAIDAINNRFDQLRVFVTLSDIEAKANEKRVHISRAVL